MRLEGKSALITGAARGIGAAFARAYVEEGATVAIGDIDDARAAATAAEIGARAYPVHLDVTDQASIDAAVAEVVAKAGGLDILVNNAALFDLAPDRRDHPRELRPAVPHQCRRHALHAAGRGEADDRAGPRRQDHQHGEPGRPPRREPRRHLLRDQGRGDQPDPVGRPQPDRAPDQRERHRPRRGRGRALGPRRRALRQVREPPARREEAPRRRERPLRPHGHRRRIWSAWRSSSPRRRPTTSSPRPTTSTAASG